MGLTTDSPLVSVIIPAYNAEALIERTLASVCAQTYDNLEIIVVDDGSRDRTTEIVRNWEQRDSRIKLIIQANAGVAAARNAAIHNAKGEFIAPIDADDIWYPTKIEHQVRYMQNTDSSIGLVYTWSVFVDENDMVVGECDCDCKTLNMHSLEGDVFPLLIYQNFIGNASVPLFRRQSLEVVGGYKYNHCEDWELTLRIAAKYQIGVIPAFLVGYRHLEGTASGNIPAMAQAHRQIFADLQQHHQQIEPQFYRWANSLFYLYIASKAYANRQHWPTIYLLIWAIQADWLTLWRWQIYIWLMVCVVKLICTPFQPIFIHFTRLKSYLKSKYYVINQLPQKHDNFWQLQIYQRAKPEQPSTYHEVIATQRGIKLLESCKEHNYHVRICHQIDQEYQII